MRNWHRLSRNVRTAAQQASQPRPFNQTCSASTTSSVFAGHLHPLETAKPFPSSTQSTSFLRPTSSTAANNGPSTTNASNGASDQSTSNGLNSGRAQAGSLSASVQTAPSEMPSALCDWIHSNAALNTSGGFFLNLVDDN